MFTVRTLLTGQRRNVFCWLVDAAEDRFERILRRMQALAEGDLSQSARPRATQPARDADLRLNARHNKATTTSTAAPQTVCITASIDRRLPPPGTILTRPYKGQFIQVHVLTEGFAYAGRIYPSLSAVAKTITGSHTNGYLFFRNTFNRNKETT